MTPRPTLTYLLKQTPSRALLTILPALALSSGCSMGGYSSGDLGVTPGGVQDNRYARELIEDGQIPDETAFRAEGILSEHDLPFTKGDACTELLCPRAAVARHQPVDGGDPQLLVQLGFATSIDAESFERRPLNLALAVDISGSMSGEKLDSVKEALTAMVDQLDGHDRVALAIFDDTAELRLKSTVMDEGGRDELRDAIAALEVRGGTNIEAGLSLAYAQVDAESLPFADNSLDLITIAFGLRNVTQKEKALAAMFRALKPGGRALVLEFSKPTSKPLEKLYDLYSFHILPRMGELVAKDADSYRYLAESIRMHPDQATLKEMMEDAGFERCDVHNLTGGIVAVHRGFKL